MIVSASRRTDIPNYYSDWFFNRIDEGFVCVRNPMNPRQVSRVSLSPDVVDGIVFWTKNPAPMLKKLDRLRDYVYYFQFTLTPYGKDVEPNLPSKNDALVPAFQALADRIGKNRVVWRYDPILFNEKYTFDYHLQYFEALARRLAGYTDRCTVSFLDAYRHIRRATDLLKIAEPDLSQKEALMRRFVQIAGEAGMTMDTCAEAIDLSRLGVGHARCIDPQRLEALGGYPLDIPKDKNQRPECGCAAGVDIGAYDTCRNGCLYCYANRGASAVRKNAAAHDPASPLLSGRVEPGDVVTERVGKSYRGVQTKLTL
jgi:hypothetical protein